ncbi:MAG TPA: NAD(+) synthase [Chloroflexi bacterium]|nr:NAD(+) synthase [Chloroflexota bacterium]
MEKKNQKRENLVKQKNKFKLNLCVPELRVADVAFNLEESLWLLEQIKQSSKEQQLCLFPQLSLSGSSCADLFSQPLLARSCLEAVQKIEEAISSSVLNVIVGLPLRTITGLYDAVAIISGQGLQGFVINPEPDLRYFQADLPDGVEIFSWQGSEVPISRDDRGILPPVEDRLLRIAVGNSRNLPLTKGEIVLNSCALPALADENYKAQFSQLSQNDCLVAVCSSGASESTGKKVFSGLAQVWYNGNLVVTGKQISFKSQITRFEFPSELKIKPITASQPKRDQRTPFLFDKDQQDQFERILEIQTAGLMGRLRHTGSNKLVLGVSGGADSTMALFVCCLALDKLGLPREDLIAVSMPGPGSSSNSLKRIDNLMKLTGVTSKVIPIHAALQQHLAAIGHDGSADLAFENAQARERTQILMDLANMHRGLVVGTGDMSEIALGWSTYSGDQISMYNVNAGLPKTVLLQLLVWAGNKLFGVEGERLAITVAEAPISPELQPLQADGSSAQPTEKILGPYLLHDFFLWHAIGEKEEPKQIFEEALKIFKDEYEAEFILNCLRVFYQRFFRNQFKRIAAPDAPQLFSLSLEACQGWRMPADASPNLWLAQLDEIKKSLHKDTI